MSAAIYCRISDDRTGERAGVTRQEADCQALADRKSWPVTDVLVDNDVGAWSGKARPAYTALLAGIKDGRYDAVIVWHLDRLTRRPADLETFFDVCDAAGVKDLASCTGDIDLSTHDGRFMARILGAVARKESDDKSRRCARKHLELAEQGRPVGGTRPFGYEADKVTVRESEAALIREAAGRVLAGDTLWAITADWGATGIPASRGGRWTQTAIRRILTSARVAGWRSLDGTVVARGTWDPILDEVTWRRVTAILAERGTVGFPRARRYLLTGYLWCGKCGTRLIARATSGRKRTYVCSSHPDKGGCGGTRITAEALEADVVGQALAVLASPEFAAHLAETTAGDGDAALVEGIQDLEQRLEQLARDHYVAQVISRAQLVAASQRLEHEAAALRRRLALSRQRHVLAPVLATGVGATEFADLSLDRQRAVIGELIDRITIGPGTPGLGRYDPGRATITWTA